MMPKISVVLGSFNQKSILEMVLAGYETQTASPDSFEVIVVDSSSTDGTGDYFLAYSPRYGFNGIVQANTGKASARNRGVSEAKSPLIIITDSDMIPHPEFIQTHIDAHNQTTVPTCFEGVTLNLTDLHWPPIPKKTYPYITPNYADGKKLGWWYFLTGNISFPKTLFDQFNGFDVSFGGYGWEDLELGYRMYQTKIPLFFLKNAKNYHYHVVSEAEEIIRNVQKGESAKIFVAKHPELKWFLGMNPLSIWCRRRLHENGCVVNWMKRHFYLSTSRRKHAFGVWFFKEFNYLSGVLSLPHINIT